MKYNIFIGKYRFQLFVIVLNVFLIPQIGFSWGENKHSIDEVLVQQLLLTENYVFCGTNASWGTNKFGLFVFDRRTETWSNYCEGNDFPSNKINKIEREGQNVYVRTWSNSGPIVRFDLNTGKHETVKKESFKFSAPGFNLKIGDKNYNFVLDSIVVSSNNKEEVYRPSTPPAQYTQTPGRLREGYYFSYPIFYENKIYFAYNFYEYYESFTRGIGSFDISSNSFNFYPSEIFKGGDITGCFTHNSSLIFSTADFGYEGNARRAVGFVEFSPADASFKIWNELPFPSDSLAIFCLEQDSLEYWIGTDRGVFRINKKTGKCIHYGIRKGLMPRDGINVYSSYEPSIGSLNQYPVIAELNKCDTAEILGVLNGWCEIKAPVEIKGFVSASDVAEEIAPSGREHPPKVRLKTDKGRIKIKYSSSDESNNLLILGESENPPDDEYIAVGYAGKKNLIKWYRIIIPTAWILMNDITFSFEEIK
jgi:hypothetical protein